MISDPMNTQACLACTGKSLRMLQSFPEIAVQYGAFFRKQLIGLAAQEPQGKLLGVECVRGFFVEAANRHGEFRDREMQAVAQNPLDKK